MKLLLYCTKAKPYLMKYKDGKYKEIASFYNKQDLATYDLLNGKIVAECDFEVEEIFGISRGTYQPNKYDFKWEDRILNGACLTNDQMNDYIPHYAIHIKNLHIFDEPRELNAYHFAPHLICLLEEVRNIQYVYDFKGIKKGSHEDIFEKKIIIPVSPQEMCRIANKEQTVLVRKKVLKEMK